MRRLFDRIRRRARGAWRDEKGDGSTSGGGDTGGHPSNDSGGGGSSEGSGGADDTARDAGLSRQLTKHAQQRVREVVGAALGRARKAGLDIPGRDATLNDLVDLAVSLKAKTEELEEAALAPTDGKPKGDRGEEIKALQRELKTAQEAIKAKDRIIAEKTDGLEAATKRTDKLLVHRELRVRAKALGFNEDALLDWWFSELNDNPHKIGPPGDVGEKYRVLDKVTGGEAINPQTGAPYVGLDELLTEIKADPANARLVAGKVAGAPGGGGGKDAPQGNDGGSSSKPTDATTKDSGGKPKTAADWFAEGIADGELGAARPG